MSEQDRIEAALVGYDEARKRHGLFGNRGNAVHGEALRAALAAADRGATDDSHQTALLARCRCILNNMAWERTGLEVFTKGRWPISHEPLRADAKNLLPEIDAALARLPAVAQAARFRDALERIALLDEADGHELTVKQAFEAVAIAANTLGMHPSQIFVERQRRLSGKSREP